MARTLLLAAVAVGVIHFNEASDSVTVVDNAFKVKSQAEIMSEMTVESAVDVFLGMNQTSMDPELKSFIRKYVERKFSNMLMKSTSLRGRKSEQQKLETEHDSNQASSLLQSMKASPTGYSALDKATKMLNEMGQETQEKLMLEEIRCGQYEVKQWAEMDSTRQAVVQANSQAANARGRVIGNQGIISSTSEEITQLSSQFDAHKTMCKDDIEQLSAQLAIVQADLKVMSTILTMTKCDKSLLLISCKHCSNSVMLQHSEMQEMVDNLQSEVAQQFMRSSLKETYEEAMRGHMTMALTQEAVDHIAKTKHKKKKHSRPEVNTSDVPVTPARIGCVKTTKCSIGSSPNCKKLRNRFVSVQVGIQEKEAELKQTLADRQSYCEEETEKYKSQLSQKNQKLRKARANLATATEDQNSAESESHSKSGQHANMVIAYQKEMKTCCGNQNEAQSELCALGKIRGELMKMEGQNTFITDCAVSDWQAEECTVTCGGGTRKKTRTVVVHKVGDGMECPPLKMEENCNEQACPVDCELEDWSGWSSCSAECGGGVIERSRSVKVEPEHGGNPCGSTEEEESCNMQSCDKDCVLSEWTEWSECSKMCGGGLIHRVKTVLEPAAGTGHCPEELQLPERLAFMKCNEDPCETLLSGSRSLLMCQSMVDIIILLDGSSALEQEGWAEMKNMTHHLVQNFKGGDDKVKVALQVFSGPEDPELFDQCTGSAGGEVNMEEMCGVKWVTHLTSDTEDLSEKALNLDWPAGSAMTSMSLGQAESELVNGRESASTVVLVITGAQPLSPSATREAAKTLKKKAKLVWVAVGQGAPVDLISEIAGQPLSDHFVHAPSFNDLSSPTVFNQIMLDACPKVD